MSIFRSRGFDSLIGQGTHVSGELAIAPDSTLQLDGEANCRLVHILPLGDKVPTKTTLRVNGELEPAIDSGLLSIIVHNVIINGRVRCDEIRVEGMLAIKSGAHLRADKIFYRELVIETGAVVHGQMFHLDHVSQGEQV